jgi:hypothetical protein
MNRILQAALSYSGQLGFSVIPVAKDKRPLIKWEAYQKQRPTEDEIKSWYEKWPDANVGIVTGMISKLAVIDLDEPDKARPVLEELIPDSMLFPISKTPSGGEHWYFYCDNPRIRNNTRAIPGADLRGEGGFVVAPPSVNGDGKGYSWLPDLKITKVDLPVLPDAYVNYINYINRIIKHLIRGVWGDALRTLSPLSPSPSIRATATRRFFTSQIIS